MSEPSNTVESVDDKPLPLSETPSSVEVAAEPTPAIAPVVPYLKGTVTRETTGVVIRGRWGFDKLDVDENDPSKVSPFEFSYLGEVGPLIEAEVGTAVSNPPSGEYKGHICLKVEGRPHTRIAEHEVEINFSEDNKITGKGYNKYGCFILSGSVLEGGGVEITKSYTLDPVPDRPKKRPKEPKKVTTSSALKRSRSKDGGALPEAHAPPPAPPATPLVVPVEEPCMRGEMEISAEGTVQIKGRWALQRSDFAEQPKNTSPFDYSLEGVSSEESGPVGGRYSGGFSMKIAGRTKRIKEADIDFTFTASSSSDSYVLKASGSNEFGVFVMKGTATPSTVSTSANAYSIEIFRTYTSYHPPPTVAKTGRGWAIEPPKVSTTPSSLSRLTSAPASKEPRSGLTSKSKMPAPSPLMSSVSESGRKRKAPTKLVDELNIGSRDSGAFDQATRSKLERLVQHLKGRESSVYFLEPVDPVRLGIPTYFDIIKQPMDLKTVERKLVTNEYSTIHEFADDIRLIFDNSKRFNEIDKTMPVYIATLKLEGIFETKWRDFEAWRNTKLEAEREKEALASASKAPTSSKTPSEKKKASTTSATSAPGGVRRSKSQASFSEADEKFQDMQTKMFEMSQEILNLQRAATTQNIQLQIANATGGRKKNGRALNVSDVLPQDDPVAESLLETIPLTMDEKETLTKQVDKLPVAKLNRVIEIVQEQMQLSGFDDDAEIELDVDTLPIPTLRALQRYLRECFPKRAPPSGIKKQTKRKVPAALPVPTSYAPPTQLSAPPKTKDNRAKRPKVEPVARAVPPSSNGNDTSDSEDESTPLAAPWESSATVMDAAESRRNAGLDSDSEDEPTQPPVHSSSSSSSSSTALAASEEVLDSGKVQLVEAVPRDTEVKVANMGAWSSGWGAPTAEAPELGRERSDSYDDTASNWSQLKTDIQEKHQVDEYRKMEEVKLLQQKQQMQVDAQARARQLQETQKRNEEAARHQALADEEAVARRLEEARLAARQQREGGGTMDLDANKTRENVHNFFENL